jgi:hypothetical protein
MTVEQRAEYHESRKKYWADLWRKPGVRYASAALLVLGAVLLLQGDGREKTWFLAAILFVYALIRARELSLLVLGLGAVYLLFIGVAALPISIAVIVGALIIAAAIRK